MLLLAEQIDRGAQFLIATHSPILMSMPDTELLLIEDGIVRSASIEDTEHYQVTRAILQNPLVFWKHLRG